MKIENFPFSSSGNPGFCPGSDNAIGGDHVSVPDQCELRKKFDQIPWPKSPKTLPETLSKEEVLAGLEHVRSIKHRAIITEAYAAGMRISEVCTLHASSFPKYSKSQWI